MERQNTTMERQTYNDETAKGIPLSARHSSACLLKEVCLSAKRRQTALQKASFYSLKDRLLQAERPPFGTALVTY